MSSHTGNRGVVRTLIDNSFLLVAGAVIALIWANIDTESYNHFVHFDVTSLWSDHEAAHGADGHAAAPDTHAVAEHAAGDDHSGEHADHSDHTDDAHAAEGEDTQHTGHHGLSIHFIINDILMALFFAIAAKEVWESLLPGGALANPRKAATPLLATAGGNRAVGPRARRGNVLHRHDLGRFSSQSVLVTVDARIPRRLRGEQVFATVGCAVCHVPNLGVAQGIYSDLLLHEMGNELIDLNHAEPYATRRTPIVRHDYSESVTTETSAGSMGAYYGATTSIRTTDPTVSVSPTMRSRARRNSRNYQFTAPDYPSRLINIIDIASQRTGSFSKDETLNDGRRRVSRGESTLNVYVRVHYEPTLFNQEWRTPPLWGVADSAPYMHDGRAETLLEAITMHDGEAAGTRDRFLNLTLADRYALIAFLETLVVAPNVPKPQP